MTVAPCALTLMVPFKLQTQSRCAALYRNMRRRCNPRMSAGPCISVNSIMRFETGVMQLQNLLSSWVEIEKTGRSLLTSKGCALYRFSFLCAE